MEQDFRLGPFERIHGRELLTTPDLIDVLTMLAETHRLKNDEDVF